MASEGELPFQAIEGSRSTVIDFASRNEEFASIELEATGGAHVYAGVFTSLGRLSISGIRVFDGWGRP